MTASVAILLLCVTSSLAMPQGFTHSKLNAALRLYGAPEKLDSGRPINQINPTDIKIVPSKCAEPQTVLEEVSFELYTIFIYKLSTKTSTHI